MKPVNVKSMFALLTVYMDKLDRKEIDATQACAMSKLVSQAENLLTYELKRALLLSNADAAKNFRNIEIKAFDSIPEILSSVDKNDSLLNKLNALELDLKELKKLNE